MKVLLTTINAKYIHTNRAIRILTRLAKPYFNAQWKEFTLKEKAEDIANSILLTQSQIIGFSIYIWNVTLTLEVIHLLKQNNPTLIIIGGGPEVSYDIPHFFGSAPFDYIVAGEAEEVWVPLLQSISNNRLFQHEGVASRACQIAEPLEVQKIESVPDILNDYTQDDLDHRIIYIETSRGCPFKCSFCLSSLSKGVRYFPIEEVLHQINDLTSRGAKTIKFLDRTMNTHPKRLIALCNYVAQQKLPVILQFEIAAEILTPELLEYFTTIVPQNLVRLEIGIQSTNELALQAVDRVQNVEKLLNIIRKLIESGRVVVHTDLIAGLPQDDFNHIKQSFNEVFKTFSQELQLGFLKMLRGSKIREESQRYHYQFDEQPPYELISNQFISKTELDRVRDVEQALEVLWNHGRADRLIRHMYEEKKLGDPFTFFEEIGSHPQFSERLPLPDLYRLIWDIVGPLVEYERTYLDDLKLSYLMIHPIKPVPWWTMDKVDKEAIIQQVISWNPSQWPLELLRKSFLTPYLHGILMVSYGSSVIIDYVTPNSIDTLFRKPL